MKPIFVYAGDVFFNRSTSLLGLAIRWGETDKGESPAWTNHTGVVVEDGWIGGHGPQATVIEALWKTRRGPLELEPGVETRVFGRTTPLEPWQLDAIRARAASYVGDTYGWWKLLFHLADRIWYPGRKVISEFLAVDSRPICSYLAAEAFAAAGIRFGVDPQAADPDGMMDYCLAHPGEWRERL